MEKNCNPELVSTRLVLFCSSPELVSSCPKPVLTALTWSRKVLRWSLWVLIRHSPPGMPYGFVNIFNLILFFSCFFILPPPRFTDDNFWPRVMVIGRSVSFSDPARPPGGGVGCPKHPKIPPPKKENFRRKLLSSLVCMGPELVYYIGVTSWYPGVTSWGLDGLLSSI